MKPALLLAAAVLPGFLGAQSYYKAPPLFSTAPSEKVSVSNLTRFGPVGLSIDLHQPAFVMKVHSVEKGSPAEATGQFKPNQTIESINGRTLKDIDPRILLGKIIEDAEASDGVLRFMVKDDAASPVREVIVKIPALGAYSKTWPLDCPKSERIVRNFADYLAKPDSNKGFADAGMLFLLATGEEKDLAVVREWVHSLAGKKQSGYAWHIGFGGIPLCEYYLRTGDPVALTVIQQWVELAAKGEYLDAWAGRGGVVKLGYGNGHLNAGGTAVVTFLMLAKQCGAEINDSLLHRTLVHFYRYAGRGINPYGDDRPETSFVDNGKNGNLAFAMAAAAALTPDGENSVYARARDVAAMSSFYTTTFMLHGHTGGGIGEIWRSAAMGLLREKKPLQYREFMDNRKWHYDLSRRFDGSFAILGGAGYDDVQWGGCYAWTYVIPRKTLRITGAPPTKFSKSFQLPARPWGVEADEAFLTLEPASTPESKGPDLAGEVLARDSAKPLIERLNATPASDDEVRRYVHHPEYLIRHMVANHAAGLTFDYMFPKPGPALRPALLEEFCRSSDPRVRNSGLRSATLAFDPKADWSIRLFNFAVERLKDENESWWIKDACLGLMAKATPDQLVPHVDLVLSYVNHPEQWLQNRALVILATLATDERVAEKVLPPMGKKLSTTPRQSTTSGPLHILRTTMPGASEKVRAIALKTIGDVYVGYDEPTTWEGGQDLAGHRKDTLEMIASTLVSVPGGHDVLFAIAKKQHPDSPLPHDTLFLEADPEQFGPELKTAILPLIREKLIYQYIGKNRSAVLADVDPKTNRGSVTNSIDGLVDLYQKVGVRDFDWKGFGPGPDATKWFYHSFDPPEKQAYDKSPWRYRPVTLPAGMENFHEPSFDPAKAGWKEGLLPIGQFNGKLSGNGRPEARPDTVWTTSPRTLWEKEVLLVRGTFQFPPAKPGHMYRLRVQTGQGVGAGDGFKVYLNGKELVETKEGLGRRAGDTIRGAWINSETAAEFAKGPVTIAAITFLRYGDRAIVTMPPVPQGIFSLWVEERKLPPLDQEVMRKAAAFIPFLSAEWQMRNDPENDKTAGPEEAYTFDGKFVANPDVSGKWTTVDTVKSIDDFNPAKKTNAGRPLAQGITFLDQGATDSPRFLWTGDTLLDLDSKAALRITPKTIEGTDYLFIESGGFSTKNPADWKSPLTVFKKS